MKIISTVIFLHILFIGLLIWLGIALNDEVKNEYTGVITVFSIALALYTTALNFLYQRWQRFYLFINRVLLKLRRTHTFWQPHFRFILRQEPEAQIIGELWKYFQAGQHGSVIKRNQTPSTLEITIDELFVAKIRLDQNCLELYFEQKLLVPSHLYNEYRRKLSRLAEGIASRIKPASSKYSILISFDENNQNPYFGFFVNRVPAQLLQTFQVTFRLTSDSDCFVEAGIDRVNIEGGNFTDTFEALGQILKSNSNSTGRIKMKPFQFYTVEKMPDLKPRQSISHEVQLTFSGEHEDVKTTITMEAEHFEGSLALLRVVSGIKHQTIGYIKTLIDSQKKRIDFSEYLQPVDFKAYFDSEKKLMIFEAPKKVCRGVLSHLKTKPCGIDLIEMEVDFTKVMQLISEYRGAWFKGVSSRVHTAGLTGSQIQDDSLFKNLSKVAVLSNVTIPWPFDGLEHHVMVTSRAGVVLIQNYQDNIGIELNLVRDVQDKLLQHVWHEREMTKEVDDIEILEE